MRRECVVLLLVLASTGVALRAVRRQSPPVASACVALFVSAAEADPRSAVASTATDLSRVLQARGVCVARSRREADAVVDVLARRQVRQARSTTVKTPILLDLIRMQITMGEETAEVRAYGDLSYQVNQAAIEAAATEVQGWLKGRAAPPRPDMAHAVESSAGEREALLLRAAEYVAAYETQFATVIGEERYRQQFTVERYLDINVPSRVTKTARSSRSEVSLAWFPDVPGWFGFRDVIEVDGKAVRDRDRRLATLFFQNPSGKLLKRALAESARYNLGTIRRNFNVPMVALQFLDAALTSRFRFEEVDSDVIGGTPVRVVRYQETAHPSIILVDERDAPARGRFWLEAATGRVLKTELALSDTNTDIRITTWYRPDARLGILVPSRMRESYDYTGRLYDLIECDAAYTNFRRFETGARLVTPK